MRLDRIWCVVSAPEAKAIRLHVPAGSTLKGTLTHRKTSLLPHTRFEIVPIL